MVDNRCSRLSLNELAPNLPANDPTLSYSRRNIRIARVEDPTGLTLKQIEDQYKSDTENEFN